MSTAADLETHLRRQGAACGDIGSPMYEALLSFAADDYAAGGPVAEVCRGWTLEPGPAVLALRLAGTVHRFALSGQAPDLARFYPSVAGEDVEPFDPGAAWTAFRDVLVARPEEVRAGLASPPQTNEIGRSAVLIGGLLHLRARFDLPVRLVEIGASAGLNLRPDQVRIDLAHGDSVGPGWSPVTLYDPWHGSLPPLDLPIEIVERRGTDLDPVDVAAAAGRLRLLSYVWPDQAVRINRLHGAFDLAAALPIPVVQEDAVRTVSALKPAPGTATVIWHSVMAQYLSNAGRAELDAAFDDLGALATPDAPVARLAFEANRFPSPAGVLFGLTLQTWPGGAVTPLASAHPHGDTVTWLRN
ncbi:DUF2332 domain-containing protein [Sporichthya sp.]|uniref:DUF2332 domain-containing protein n=1 Tax=Sporichthya sp. TaxID=65475 RepID=UPI00179E6048|nr:DUF2332 domain-containing protein [Sporichthya sp.]MBA3743038.1 DUF2332 domain-containing protein [Sporichthya sp.]